MDNDTLELVVSIDDSGMCQRPFVASRQALNRWKELTEQLGAPSEAFGSAQTRLQGLPLRNQLIAYARFLA